MPLYDEQFYAWQADGALSSAQAVVPHLKELVSPETVIDVGCGVGAWTSQWSSAIGVDGDWVPRDKLLIPEAQFLAHDLTQPLKLGRKADLVLCLEVAEHLPPRASRTLVESLCKHGGVVAFSAAVPGQEGVDHINLHWPSYWAKLFAEHGYRPYDVVRQRIWWDQRVEWWYRQNIILFARPTTAKRLGLSGSGTTSSQNPSLDLAQPALLMPQLQPRLQATVCIPWRPSKSRLAAFERVKDFWAMFGWPVIIADSNTKVFSLAQARNNAVRQAETEVVVISDADTLVDPLNVLRAVAEPSGICWPFTKYRIIDPKYLDVPLHELASVPFINTWDGNGVAGVGGCIVATRKEFQRLGGQPPEFIGWGWEDTSFTAIAGTLSRVKRLEGHVYSFEHNQKPRHSTGSIHDTYVGAKADSPGWTRNVKRNEELFQVYRIAQGRPWLMRAVLARRAADNPEDPLNWG
jgi:Methyltransferase domain/N-terminal domain of galactosyltransferase